ncbi:hypothetical protein PENCOP_c004G08949 [Penicillium coprophilum]|uniref:Uncharacterized protein n=1 Tax=Penicillium coprophilum TaxID=36646 RepID=A0A1V6UU32_9EURO|nr:hypothetical protein PENCOP_c004G08949 [Penicillium coprophilum]
MVTFHHGHLPSWSPSIMVTFRHGHLPSWSPSITVTFHCDFCLFFLLPSWSPSTITFVFHDHTSLGNLPPWIFHINPGHPPPWPPYNMIIISSYFQPSNQLPVIKPTSSHHLSISSHQTNFQPSNQLPTIKPTSNHQTNFQPSNQLPTIKPTSNHQTNFQPSNQLPTIKPTSNRLSWSPSSMTTVPYDHIYLSYLVL